VSRFEISQPKVSLPPISTDPYTKEGLGSWTSGGLPVGHWLYPPQLTLAAEAMTPDEVFREIPRRQMLSSGAATRLAPTMMTEISYAAGLVRTLARLGMWAFGAFLFFFGVLRDILALRRDWRARRWMRLRQAFEFLGGTFIKVGQQLSMRVDLLPVELCDELGKLLDQVRPFKFAIARKKIEAAIKRPIHEVFAAFDKNPIGSASISCVYQAVLKTGERVAVKVRRPQIGEIFAADVRALGLILKVAEVLTLVRDGFFNNLRIELASMLMEELDFRVEARNQSLFRRAARKAKLRYLHAPRVYFELSSHDVMVSEFMSGVWLHELLNAVENADTESLERIRQANIDPKVVSYRLMVASVFSIYDGIIFHADPHPGNIVVQPDNQLVFIDFGSCGAYTDRERHLMQQLQYHMTRLEPSAMVQVALALQEPLPPVDISELSKKLEMAWWRQLKAMKSKDAEWWERTSAGLWLNIMKATREYNIPMNLGMLKGIRSTMLYDTIAARLNPRISAIKVTVRYWKDWQRRRRRKAARRLNRRVNKFSLRKTVLNGYLTLKGIEELAVASRFRLQRVLDSSNFNFADQVAKASFLGLTIIKLILSYWIATLAWFVAVVVHRHMSLRPTDLWAGFQTVLYSRPYWALIAVLVFRSVRQVQFRFADKETD
jgi:predicted unusual protein kinase regulating ubiquinone biosynthesis (AarF/ABC1/UbiB family)